VCVVVRGTAAADRPLSAPALLQSLEDAAALGIFSQAQALDYIGGKIKAKRTLGPGKSSLGKVDEARNVLATVVLNHVPVVRFNFRAKAIYIGHMVRRILLTHFGKMKCAAGWDSVFMRGPAAAADALLLPHRLDDKDYYGNKRLELAGQLMALLFEGAWCRSQPCGARRRSPPPS